MLFWFGYDSIIHSSYRTGMLLALAAVELLGVFLFKMNDFLSEKGITTANSFSDNFDLVVDHARVILAEFGLAAFVVVWLVVLLYVFVVGPMDKQKNQ